MAREAFPKMAEAVQDDGPGHSLAGAGVSLFMYGRCIGPGWKALDHAGQARKDKVAGVVSSSASTSSGSATVLSTPRL